MATEIASDSGPLQAVPIENMCFLPLWNAREQPSTVLTLKKHTGGEGFCKYEKTQTQEGGEATIQLLFVKDKGLCVSKAIKKEVENKF